MIRRLFQSSSISRGRFTEFLAKLPSSQISTKELSNKLFQDPLNRPTFHLLDVRETFEWNEDKIPYAIYTGRGNLERDIVLFVNEESIVPDVNEEIILYCSDGRRSKIATDSLMKMGYKNVKSLQGGMGAWKQEQNQVITNTTSYSERVNY